MNPPNVIQGWIDIGLWVFSICGKNCPPIKNTKDFATLPVLGLETDSELEIHMQISWEELLETTPAGEWRGKTGQREKSGCNAVTAKASADPPGAVDLGWPCKRSHMGWWGWGGQAPVIPSHRSQHSWKLGEGSLRPEGRPGQRVPGPTLLPPHSFLVISRALSPPPLIWKHTVNMFSLASSLWSLQRILSSVRIFLTSAHRLHISEMKSVFWSSWSNKKETWERRGSCLPSVWGRGGLCPKETLDSVE